MLSRDLRKLIDDVNKQKHLVENKQDFHVLDLMASRLMFEVIRLEIICRKSVDPKRNRLDSEVVVR